MSSQNKFISFCFFFLSFFVCLFVCFVFSWRQITKLMLFICIWHLRIRKNRHNGDRVSVPAFKCSIEASVCKPFFFFFFFRHKLYISWSLYLILEVLACHSCPEVNVLSSLHITFYAWYITVHSTNHVIVQSAFLDCICQTESGSIS